MKFLVISEHKNTGQAAAPSVYLHLNQELKQLAFSSYRENYLNDFK
jgi:hypothetical protein